jgi:hypothetical protein
MEMLQKHFSTVAKERMKELENRATSIKMKWRHAYLRVKEYLDDKQPIEDAPPDNDGTSPEHPHSSPTEEPITGSSGQPPPDDNDLDKSGGYAGYKHHQLNKKRIAHFIWEHRQLRSNGFIFIQDFDTLTEGANWLTQREPFPPMHHVRRDTHLMLQYNSPDIETRRLNDWDEEIRREVGHMYSPDGYFGYNERGPTGGAYRINGRGEKEHLDYLFSNIKMAGRRVLDTKMCETANEEFAR